MCGRGKQLFATTQIGTCPNIACRSSSRGFGSVSTRGRPLCSLPGMNPQHMSNSRWWKYLQAKWAQGRVLGPMTLPLLPSLQISLFGVIPSKCNLANGDWLWMVKMMRVYNVDTQLLFGRRSAPKIYSQRLLMTFSECFYNEVCRTCSTIWMAFSLLSLLWRHARHWVIQLCQRRWKAVRSPSSLSGSN